MVTLFRYYEIKNLLFMKKFFTDFHFITLLVFLVLGNYSGFGQVNDEMKMEEKVASPAQFSLGADLVSRYIWRGRDYGNSPAIQPNVAFSVAGFKIGAWGSYGFVSNTVQINDSTTVNAGNYAETDWNLSYSYKGFTVMLSDYFFPNPLSPNENVNYFDYNNKTTGHSYELSLAYTGPDKFPLQLYAGTIIYGADKDKDSTGVFGAGDNNNYSTYFEAAYQFNIKTIGVKPFIGGIPFGSSWYGPSAGIINLGVTVSKSIQLSKDYSIPLFTSVVTNPQAQSIFFVFGLSL